MYKACLEKSCMYKACIEKPCMFYSPLRKFLMQAKDLVKKLLNLFAISFFSVSIFPSTLKNSGSCILVVVLLVTSLMTFHVFLISFVYFVSFC